MPEDLKILLIVLAICTPTGLFLGVAIRKLRPQWYKSYAKFCLDRKWWMFAFGVVFFSGFSIVSFVQGRPYFGSCFALFALLEAYSLFAFGFKKLTPEQAAWIDASDPTKLRPIVFWKQTTNGECVSAEEANNSRP